jgi:DNA-binding beta-propeller fold protein YncE
MSDRRVPCPACKTPILEGAKKCFACKKWIVDPPPAAPKLPRAGLIMVSAVATVMAVIVTSRESPVGEAPPLTPLGPAGSSSAAAAGHPAPAAIGPETPIEAEKPRPPADPTARWKARELKIGEVHPLDLEFSPKGDDLYVSADDATLREYRVKSGDMIHKASVPAQGDHIRLLFDRYIAVLRHEDAGRIPIMDTTAWDHDPLLLDVGRSPGDIIALPDGKSVIAATTEGKHVIRYELPSGARVADIVLPHATGQLFLVHAEGRPYVAAMGALSHGGQPAGAWIDLFDPDENPFGATRRSISVGREPQVGSVSANGGALFFPDRQSNSATLLRVAATTVTKTTAVGQGPVAAFLLDGDRWGITLNGAARTATVVDLATMKVHSTLMLSGEPSTGVASSDGRTLFVALGGRDWPPKGSGVAVIGGDPPRVLGSLATGQGACAVAVARDGSRAAVANWWDKSLTVLEQ